MNAIINLNHFCEVHGPQTIFTTQTIRDKSYIQNSSSTDCSSQNIINCESCSSIGSKMYFVSEDNSIMFVSSEKSLFGKEHQNALKQAALRSLCEISSNNQENLVFFGDSRINSLCYSFKIKDSYARGFEKLYSIVIIMKDKMFLLNAQPFLAHNIKEIAKQIQESALKVYETEQKQFSQRAERLNTGKLSDLPSRSLKILVGEQHIFAQLHSLFSWILWAGARYFTEVLTLGSPSMPSFCKDSPDGFAFISIDKEEFMMQNFPQLGDNSIYDGEYNLRNLKQVSKMSFNQLLYCSLVGIQIVIRGKNNDFYKYFKEFMPQAFHHLIVESPKYMTVQKCRILSLPSTDIFIPQNNVCRIDFMDELDVPTFIKYPMELPSKLPTLMTKILYAVDEKLFTNNTMYKYIQAIIEEWKNKIICLSHHHHHHDDMAKLKKVLEIQSHDEELVKYWISVL
ncbi:folliculin [Chironomus tepperi]|uniref:folliculin n=1 Tax=Chironomus tepperi TaxID=113505 RepID=UPI00391F7F76